MPVGASKLSSSFRGGGRHVRRTKLWSGGGFVGRSIPISRSTPMSISLSMPTSRLTSSSRSRSIYSRLMSDAGFVGVQECWHRLRAVGALGDVWLDSGQCGEPWHLGVESAPGRCIKAPGRYGISIHGARDQYRFLPYQHRPLSISISTLTSISFLLLVLALQPR